MTAVEKNAIFCYKDALSKNKLAYFICFLIKTNNNDQLLHNSGIK